MSSGIWKIKDSDGNVVNRIKGKESWVKSTYEFYEEDNSVAGIPEPTEDQVARRWRDAELLRTDSLVGLADHPDKDKFADYRQALRDWPSTSDFPNKKPTIGS